MTNAPYGLKIVEPGIQTLLMDAGRKHSMHTGLTESGPMDAEAAEWANWLCGNATSPYIEIMGAARFVATSAITVAVTGPLKHVSVDEQVQAGWQTIKLKEGDTLSIEPMNSVSRCYLSVEGHWQVSQLHESCATVVREKLGGPEGTGRPLGAATMLPVRAGNRNICRRVPEYLRPQYGPGFIDVIPAFQYEQFSGAARARFFASEFTLTSACDRMGYRLSGPGISHRISAMYSEGITLGAIQIPADGQPIVMLRDRQTLGGYPKIGAVAAYDIGRLSQCQPQDVIQFSEIPAENARAKHLLRYYQRQRYIESLL